MKAFYLEIITPSKTAFSGNVFSVTIPGTLGSFQVLYNHAPLISSFEIGLIKIVLEDNSERFYATSGGTTEVLNNRVLILSESLESPLEIDVNRAKSALSRAQERLKDRANKETDFARAEASLARAMNRINIAAKYRGVTNLI